MIIESLVATMYQKDYSLIEQMNIKTACVVVNQTDFEKYPILNKQEDRIVYQSNEDRGLSKSRNIALSLSTSDICLIADDDLTYIDGYDRIVKDAYTEFKDADVICFDFNPVKSGKRKYSSLFSVSKRITKMESLSVSSVRITFKRKSIIENKIVFNELFGAGATFISGEENLFLKDCFDAGLKVFYVPKILSKVDFSDSSWFNSFDRAYFETKGAFAEAFFGKYYLLYMLSFLIKNYKIFKKDSSLRQAYFFMQSGRRAYIASDK